MDIKAQIQHHEACIGLLDEIIALEREIEIERQNLFNYEQNAPEYIDGSKRIIAGIPRIIERRISEYEAMQKRSLNASIPVKISRDVEIKAVWDCLWYTLPLDQAKALISKSRKREYSDDRNCIIAVMCNHYGAKYYQYICSLFGRNRTIAYNAINKVANLCETSAEFKQTYDLIKNIIENEIKSLQAAHAHSSGE